MRDIDSAAVMQHFLDRLRRELADSNTLRGSWVEQIVAASLGIGEFPGPWSYYDLRHIDGRTISVKQSVGPKARFDVSRRLYAWDNELAALGRASDATAEGWLPNPSARPARWCDLYVFGHLDGSPTQERVEDALEWRFAVRSRSQLDDAVPDATSLTVARLERIGATFFPASELLAAISAIS